MARLILFNGPPGIGKSTLARRYVAQHPLAFCLDLDGFRRLIGQWETHQRQSGTLARAMAIEMARAHLAAGHDVVVPQYVADEVFLDALERLAASTQARYHEVWLTDRAEDALARFHARATDPDAATHHAEAVRQIGGDAGFRAMYDELHVVLRDRPKARKVPTTRGAEEAAYAAIEAALTEPE